MESVHEDLKQKRMHIERELAKICRFADKVNLRLRHVMDAKARALTAVGKIRRMAEEMEAAHE